MAGLHDFVVDSVLRPMARRDDSSIDLGAGSGLLATRMSELGWNAMGADGLQRYSEQQIIGKLTAAGFSAKRLPLNVGHNPARMTVIGRPI